MRARLVEWRAGRRRRPPRRSTSWRSQALDQSRAAISRLISRRGRSARPAADFSVRGCFSLCTAGFGTARDGRAPAGSERTRCRRTCRLTSRTRRRAAPPSTTRGCATVRARALDERPASPRVPPPWHLHSPPRSHLPSSSPLFAQRRRFSSRVTTDTASSTRARADGRPSGRAWTRTRGAFEIPRRARARFAPSSSSTRAAPVARSDTSRPLHTRLARRDGEALSAKARVPVENAPERGKPYWTLLDPREAGRLWRRNFGDKVPAEDETGMGETRP